MQQKGLILNREVIWQVALICQSTLRLQSKSHTSSFSSCTYKVCTVWRSEQTTRTGYSAIIMRVTLWPLQPAVWNELSCVCACLYSCKRYLEICDVTVQRVVSQNGKEGMLQKLQNSTECRITSWCIWHFLGKYRYLNALSVTDAQTPQDTSISTSPECYLSR